MGPRAGCLSAPPLTGPGRHLVPGATDPLARGLGSAWHQAWAPARNLRRLRLREVGMERAQDRSRSRASQEGSREATPDTSGLCPHTEEPQGHSAPHALCSGLCQDLPCLGCSQQRPPRRLLSWGAAALSRRWCRQQAARPRTRATDRQPAQRRPPPRLLRNKGQ